MEKLWGGRFSKKTDDLVQQLNASLPFDVRLYNEDIDGSLAWVEALAGAGLLARDETLALAGGLEQVRTEFAQGTIESQPGDEDVHTLVERRLTELVGPVGGKLHTGRSRNDQVATDFRLWIMRAVDRLQEEVRGLQSALADSAAAHLDLPLPGYTHLQHAQPITWGHWALSHFWPLARDMHRLNAVREAAAVLPLGSAALAGTAFPIDRSALARKLDFAAVSDNSIDAVADRDFAVDFLYAAAMTGIHLSRLSEQLIIFSSAEFGFVVLDDAFATGSSLMPQKKNPDTLELTRGKSGRLVGNLTGMMVTLKGLPSAYDKDLQEDKEPVFDSFDTLMQVLPVMAGLIRMLELRPARMTSQLEANMLATDLADYLVRKGLPFRQAHHLVGQAVARAEQAGLDLTGLSLADLQAVSDWFGPDTAGTLNVSTSLASRAVPGGTAPAALQTQLVTAQASLAELRPDEGGRS
jgi:argininosuccinate lyase